MRILKILALSVLGLIVLTGVAVGGALGYRSYRQHRNSDSLSIRTEQGIEQGMFVDIGGLRQWLQIRGEDRNNPVILFVHGGPALSMIPFTYRSMRAWEKYFTIVQWDQRGAGRTYLLNGGADQTASGMAQIVDDGVRVSEFTRHLLHKDKIIVLGESWGSAVALEMARRRADLFYRLRRHRPVRRHAAGASPDLSAPARASPRRAR
ncbi:MAG: alpha/beta hydrolase [Steroidobacteraceae bacterium]